MSKKKHPEHVNHERWLVSYADFITLLFAFFVVLFASGQSDKAKRKQLTLSMQTAFEHNGIFDPHSKAPPLTEGTGASSSTNPTPIQLPLPGATGTAATEQQLNRMLTQQVTGHHIPADSVTMHTTGEGLVISLHEAGFFASGSADVRPASIPLIQQIAATLPPGPIRIEGHTDNVPIHTAQFASNWELSTSRAARIARIFLDRPGANPADLSAAGYAEFHPVADNATEAGRAQNRRIDVILLHPPTATAQTAPATPPPPPAPSR